MIQAHLDKKLWIITGKGGVGKSTLAESLAQESSAKGKKVLWLKITNAGQDENIVEQNLTRISLNPYETLKEYIDYKIPVKALSRLLSENTVMEALFKISPGLTDLALIGKAVFEAQNQDWDLVVFDAPSTGHGIGMFYAPMIYEKIFSRGTLHEDNQNIIQFLRDPSQTSIFLITLPEEMPLAETTELHGHLTQKLQLPIGGLFFNRLHTLKNQNEFPEDVYQRIEQSYLKPLDYHYQKAFYEQKECRDFSFPQTLPQYGVPEFFEHDHQNLVQCFRRSLENSGELLKAFHDFKKPGSYTHER
jgi:anion-transporting  ArsA/GET3 family ATPase